jgi:hypothetical protein
LLLFQKRFHAGLVSGAVRLTFRSWKTPRVKPGGRYRVHPIGVVEVERVDRVTVAEISEADARAAGFADRAELLAYARPVVEGRLTARTPMFRVALHHGGDGDRVPLALEAELGPAEVAEIASRLERLDRSGAWTRRVLRLIDRRPRVAASKLARQLGRETLPFKVEVRKLKRLGLTQSFEVGYELSPRGRRFLELEPPSRPRRRVATAR